MSEPTLHVTFNPSAAGTLNRSLAMLNRPDEVLCPFDNFSFGPIATDDPSARNRWVEQELGYTGWREFTGRSEGFLAAFGDPAKLATAWFSRKEASTYAGFLWWLAHVGEMPISIIEIDHLSSMNCECLTKDLDRSIPLSTESRAHYQARWSRLMIENAPLRVIDGENLISAPLEHFDEMLLSHATREWQKMALIVGSTLVDFYNAGVSQTGDLVLGARLADLAEAGKLEWRGDLSQMHRCELRLPTNLLNGSRILSDHE